jgi:hypothetical protein
MAELFLLFIGYQQVAVFDPALDDPFNDWGPRHVSQGFSWRSGSVSFRVPTGEMCVVEVLQGAEPSTLAGAPTRQILTPFEVEKGHTIAVGSITEENNVSVPADGKYQLSFELLPGGTHDEKKFDCGIRLRFVKENSPVFEIRKADAEMDASSPLDLHSSPAL